MPVGAPVAGHPGKQEPQHVVQLRRGAEGAPDPRHSRPLVQSQSGRNIAQILHLSLLRLGHAAAGISGKGFQVAARALGVEDAQSQGGFSGAGNPGDPHYLVERNVHIYIM